MAVHRSFSPLVLLLGLLVAMAGGLVPTELLAARSDAPTLRGHTFDPVPRSRAKTRFESWDVTVHLDAEEAIEQHISFRYVVPAKRAGEAHRLSLAVVDGARGDLCDDLDLGPSADTTLVPEGPGAVRARFCVRFSVHILRQFCASIAALACDFASLGA